jgi:hypothetical protein
MLIHTISEIGSYDLHDIIILGSVLKSIFILKGPKYLYSSLPKITPTSFVINMTIEGIQILGGSGILILEIILMKTIKPGIQERR